MPAISALSEFNRHQNRIIEELRSSEKPLYLTRNGKAAVVVMDAAAFDRMQETQAELRERELSVYSRLMRGYQDALDGNVLDAGTALQQIRDKKGW